jgi:type II secretory pathway pseudopilin PulG
MTRNPDRAARRAFTLVELIVAGTIAAMVLTAVTFSLSQLGKTRNIARDRAEAFQRATTALEAVRRDVSATIRAEDLFDARFLLATTEASSRTGGHERSDLLLFATSMRAIRPVEYQGEGREYESHFRIEDDELGSALWQRRDNVPDEVPDGGGLATPVADGVVGLLVEASSGDDSWRTDWDSDVDGIPKLVRISVTATGAEIGTDETTTTPEVTLRTVVAIDRVIAPKAPAAEEETPQDPAANGGTPTPESAGQSGALGGGGGAPIPAGGGAADEGLGGGRGRGGRGDGGGDGPRAFPGGGRGNAPGNAGGGRPGGRPGGGGGGRGGRGGGR